MNCQIFCLDGGVLSVRQENVRFEVYATDGKGGFVQIATSFNKLKGLGKQIGELVEKWEADRK